MMPSTMLRLMITLAIILVLGSFAEGKHYGYNYKVYKCHAKGDPHIRTFDRAYFPVFNACKYLMAAKRGRCAFRVDLKTEHRLGQDLKKSFTQYVEVTLRRRTIRLHSGGSVSINGQLTNRRTFKGIRIHRRGKWVSVSNRKRCGLTVFFDGDMKVTIRLRARRERLYKNRLHGLCGNLNWNKYDDLLVNNKHIHAYEDRMEGYKALARKYLVEDESNRSLECLRGPV